MAESKNLAMSISKEKKIPYINGYDHPHIIAGQGTIGLEICEQVKDADAIVVPVGGGQLVFSEDGLLLNLDNFRWTDCRSCICR